MSLIVLFYTWTLKKPVCVKIMSINFHLFPAFSCFLLLSIKPAETKLCKQNYETYKLCVWVAHGLNEFNTLGFCEPRKDI